MAKGGDNIEQHPRDDNPLDEFAECHIGIVSRLRLLTELPSLAEVVSRARSQATELLRVFDTMVLEHHADEERELFPTVIRNALPGEERESVEKLVEQLVLEHRALERQWSRLQPMVRQLARGDAVTIDASAVNALVKDYQGHAAFEEARFLPVAARILGRESEELAALGLSLHLRHDLERYLRNDDRPVIGHI